MLCCDDFILCITTVSKSFSSPQAYVGGCSRNFADQHPVEPHVPQAINGVTAICPHEYMDRRICDFWSRALKCWLARPISVVWRYLKSFVGGCCLCSAVDALWEIEHVLHCATAAITPPP